MLKAIFFDLDGTLLPMDENKFCEKYFDLLADKMKSYGYKKEDLINVIWQGTKLMYKNNGLKSNENVFWEYFESYYGKEKTCDKKHFNDFYENEFKNTKICCKENPLAKEIISFAREKVNYVILSTNPIFPYKATLERIGFIGLKESDFDYITAYENSFYTKPNPNYFKTILEKFGLKSEEVILFGNNDIEDYECAKNAGIDCYLVGDNLILHGNFEKTKIIKMDEVKSVILSEIEKRHNEI